jgi:zinc and cadmium transporter
MTQIPLLVFYCVLIVVASLVGGLVPLIVRLTHSRVETGVSFVAGFVLGVGLLHLLPEAAAQIGIESAATWVVVGLLVMFFIERFFAFHQHGAPANGADHTESSHNVQAAHELHWTGATIGLTLHSIIAGVGLAASIEAEAADEHVRWAGMAMFLVIFLHKPFDALTVGTLMAVGGRPAAWRHVVNGLFALAVPLGAALVYAGVSMGSQVQATWIGTGLAFVTGTLLCISTSDLLPELRFHRHDRVKLSAALLLGVLLAWGVGQLHGDGHGHGHEAGEPMEQGIKTHVHD